jgi:outer membrane autotransporter protein
LNSTAPPSNRWSIWIRGFGSGSRINNDASRVFNQNVGGVQIGADRHLGSLWNGDLYLGVFAGYIYASRDFLEFSREWSLGWIMRWASHIGTGNSPY